jgi:hypothetical protein
MKSLIVVLVVLGLQTSYAQEQLEHKKRIYIDKNQRLYVQDSLPVYVFLSTTPDAKDAVQLKSEKTPQYVNPMHFDGNGKHNLIHKDYEHEVEVAFEIYADGHAPQTHISLSNAVSHSKDGKSYFGKGLELVLTANDEMSGVQNTYFSVNGSPFQEYSKGLVIDKEQEYTIKYYSVDNVGNVEKVHSKSFVVDLSSPITELSIVGDHKEDILSPRAALQLKSKDSLSGVSSISYQIDGEQVVAYAGNIPLTTLKEGEHTITYFSSDYVKNKEVEKKYAFYIDKTPPLVMEDIIGDKFIVNGKEFSSGRTKVKLTAIDNKSGVHAIYYSINDAPFQLYAEPVEVSSHSGSISIRSYATDNVMNKSLGTAENSTNLKMSYVDLSGPVLSHHFQGPVFKTRDTIFISGKTKILLKGVDAESGFNRITYSTDHKEEAEYAKAFSVSEEGRHLVEYTGYDNVNNSNSGSFFFDIDNFGPEIFFKFSILPIGNTNGKNIYPGHVVLFLSATDNFVGYEAMYYSINGSKEKPYTGLIDGFQKNKTYTVRVRALDKLGNESKKETVFKTEM